MAPGCAPHNTLTGGNLASGAVDPMLVASSSDITGETTPRMWRRRCSAFLGEDNRDIGRE